MLERGFTAGVSVSMWGWKGKKVKFKALGVGGGGLSAGLWVRSVGTRRRCGEPGLSASEIRECGLVWSCLVIRGLKCRQGDCASVKD